MVVFNIILGVYIVGNVLLDLTKDRSRTSLGPFIRVALLAALVAGTICAIISEKVK